MKPLTSRSRWTVYGLALLGTLLAVRWAGGQDEAVPKPAKEATVERTTDRSAARGEASAARQTVPQLDVSRLGARAAAASERDLFPAMNWAQAAREEEIKRSPPPKPAPPPPPQAPPLPFTYMGKMLEDGKVTVFLVQGDRNLIVRQGETLQGNWRVESIAEQSMTLTYVPLNQQQVLSFAARAAGAPAPAPGAAPSPPRQQEESRKDD